jgi:hypothetical protein
VTLISDEPAESEHQSDTVRNGHHQNQVVTLSLIAVLEDELRRRDEAIFERDKVLFKNDMEISAKDVLFPYLERNHDVA